MTTLLQKSPRPRETPILVSITELREILVLGRTQFHTWRALGRIGPQPVSARGRPKWHRTEVEAWLANRDGRGSLHNTRTWPAVWETLNPALTEARR